MHDCFLETQVMLRFLLSFWCHLSSQHWFQENALYFVMSHFHILGSDCSLDEYEWCLWSVNFWLSCLKTHLSWIKFYWKYTGNFKHDLSLPMTRSVVVMFMTSSPWHLSCIRECTLSSSTNSILENMLFWVPAAKTIHGACIPAINSIKQTMWFNDITVSLGEVKSCT
jgi:hypothetical protein